MSEIDAKNHIEEAYRILTGEVYRGSGPGDMKRVEGIPVIVLDLQRVDLAIGPRGESIFGKMAEKILAAYVEIVAARNSFK